MNAIVQAFATVQDALFEHAVLPAMYGLGLMEFSEQAFDAVEFVLLGIIQIGLVYLLLRPLEALFPAERWSDRKAVRCDVLYTFLHRIGLVPIAVYIVLQPAITWVDGAMRAAGYIPWDLEQLWPSLNDSPLAAFCAYLLILDFAEYWRHRLQHRWGRWWALHAVHHSQRQLSFWADDRNHLLDDVIEGAWLTLVAFLIGVPPGQFVAAVMLTRFVESLSHANVRFGFGYLGDRLLVGPRFHRIHHGVGIGHEGARYGCNFATLFPLWDIVFGTADFSRRDVATGISDQIRGRDYGETFLTQQWLGLRRLFGRG